MFFYTISNNSYYLPNKYLLNIGLTRRMFEIVRQLPITINETNKDNTISKRKLGRYKDKKLPIEGKTGSSIKWIK